MSNRALWITACVLAVANLATAIFDLATDKPGLAAFSFIVCAGLVFVCARYSNLLEPK